ncbi:MAG TPA: DUF1697 domain-containing protein [Pyrinomonadaceae bacterium]|nr:DUF1697 domain-containing protein [Pyrinomonadaceae bacterium]
MRYIALLRGVNVGGKNMIKMETLREMVASLGFSNVKTYVNSGNVAFDAKKASDTTIAKKIHDAIDKELGMDISVMVRSADEIKKIISKNPYDGQFENDKYLHIFFLNEELSKEDRDRLLANNSDVEFISIDGRTIYYMLKISILDSVLGKGFIDKKLKIPSTARNWRTVNKVAEL